MLCFPSVHLLEWFMCFKPRYTNPLIYLSEWTTKTENFPNRNSKDDREPFDMSCSALYSESLFPPPVGSSVTSSPVSSSAAAARDASRGEGGKARASLLWVRWSNLCRLHKHMDKHHAHTKQPYIHTHKQPYIQHLAATRRYCVSIAGNIIPPRDSRNYPPLIRTFSSKA